MFRVDVGNGSIIRCPSHCLAEPALHWPGPPAGMATRRPQREVARNLNLKNTGKGAALPGDSFIFSSIYFCEAIRLVRQPERARVSLSAPVQVPTVTRNVANAWK